MERGISGEETGTDRKYVQNECWRGKKESTYTNAEAREKQKNKKKRKIFWQRCMPCIIASGFWRALATSFSPSCCRSRFLNSLYIRQYANIRGEKSGSPASRLQQLRLGRVLASGRHAPHEPSQPHHRAPSPGNGSVTAVTTTPHLLTTLQSYATGSCAQASLSLSVAS